MRFLSRILAFARYLKLNRQAREIKRIIGSLPGSAHRALATLTMAEIAAAAKEPMPHLYGSSITDRYQPWGDASDQAFERARSPVAQLKLKGIALWLAIVFHETQDAQHPGLQAVHREVLGFLGLLKGTYAERRDSFARASL